MLHLDQSKLAPTWSHSLPAMFNVRQIYFKTVRHVNEVLHVWTRRSEGGGGGGGGQAVLIRIPTCRNINMHMLSVSLVCLICHEAHVWTVTAALPRKETLRSDEASSAGPTAQITDVSPDRESASCHSDALWSDGRCSRSSSNNLTWQDIKWMYVWIRHFYVWATNCGLGRSVSSVWLWMDHQRRAFIEPE